MDPMDTSEPRGRSHNWIGRAAFEAALIVLGLVGALLLDEWRDDRATTRRVETALASIRNELDTNRRMLLKYIADNEEIMGRLQEANTTGRPYEGPVMRNFQISAVAWAAARDAGITNEIDHEVLMALGRAYDALSGQVDERSVFRDYLYTYDDIRTIRANPLRLAGWMNDMTLHARDVLKHVDAAMARLNQEM